MDDREIIILGSGTSTGVPVIGCECRICQSANPKNKRTRASIMVRSSATTLVVDTSVDFRFQMLTHQVNRVDAVLYTHSHADHLHGLDDVRPLCHTKSGGFKPVTCYGYQETLDDIEHRFSYAFQESAIPTYKPALKLVPFPDQEFIIGDIPVRVVQVIHGTMPVASFLFWGCALYATDLNHIPKDSQKWFENLEILIIGAPLMKKHPTHFSIPEAMDVIRQFGPKDGIITHLAHVVDHEEFQESLLKEGMRPAYDGLLIPVRSPYSSSRLRENSRLK